MWHAETSALEKGVAYGKVACISSCMPPDEEHRTPWCSVLQKDGEDIDGPAGETSSMFGRIKAWWSGEKDVNVADNSSGGPWTACIPDTVLSQGHGVSENPESPCTSPCDASGMCEDSEGAKQSCRPPRVVMAMLERYMASVASPEAVKKFQMLALETGRLAAKGTSSLTQADELTDLASSPSFEGGARRKGVKKAPRGRGRGRGRGRSRDRGRGRNAKSDSATGFGTSRGRGGTRGSGRGRGRGRGKRTLEKNAIWETAVAAMDENGMNEPETPPMSPPGSPPRKLWASEEEDEKKEADTWTGSNSDPSREVGDGEELFRENVDAINDLGTRALRAYRRCATALFQGPRTRFSTYTHRGMSAVLAHVYNMTLLFDGAMRQWQASLHSAAALFSQGGDAMSSLESSSVLTELVKRTELLEEGAADAELDKEHRFETVATPLDVLIDKFTHVLSVINTFLDKWAGRASLFLMIASIANAHYGLAALPSNIEHHVSTVFGKVIKPLPLGFNFYQGPSLSFAHTVYRYAAFMLGAGTAHAGWHGTASNILRHMLIHRFLASFLSKHVVNTRERGAGVLSTVGRMALSSVLYMHVTSLVDQLLLFGLGSVGQMLQLMNETQAAPPMSKTTNADVQSKRERGQIPAAERKELLDKTIAAYKENGGVVNKGNDSSKPKPLSRSEQVREIARAAGYSGEIESSKPEPLSRSEQIREIARAAGYSGEIESSKLESLSRSEQVREIARAAGYSGEIESSKPELLSRSEQVRKIARDAGYTVIESAIENAPNATEVGPPPLLKQEHEREHEHEQEQEQELPREVVRSTGDVVLPTKFDEMTPHAPAIQPPSWMSVSFDANKATESLKDTWNTISGVFDVIMGKGEALNPESRAARWTQRVQEVVSNFKDSFGLREDLHFSQTGDDGGTLQQQYGSCPAEAQVLTNKDGHSAAITIHPLIGDGSASATAPYIHQTLIVNPASLHSVIDTFTSTPSKFYNATQQTQSLFDLSREVQGTPTTVLTDTQFVEALNGICPIPSGYGGVELAGGGGSRNTVNESAQIQLRRRFNQIVGQSIVDTYTQTAIQGVVLKHQRSGRTAAPLNITVHLPPEPSVEAIGAEEVKRVLEAGDEARMVQLYAHCLRVAREEEAEAALKGGSSKKTTEEDSENNDFEKTLIEDLKLELETLCPPEKLLSLVTLPDAEKVADMLRW